MAVLDTFPIETAEMQIGHFEVHVKTLETHVKDSKVHVRTAKLHEENIGSLLKEKKLRERSFFINSSLFYG